MASCELIDVCLILPRVRWFGERQRDPEQGAAMALFDRNLTAVNFNGPFRNRQTQTGAALVSRASLVETKEAIEDALTMFARDTWTLIGDFQDRVFGVHSGTNSDSRAWRAVLDGVVEDVRDRFAKHEAIDRSDHAIQCIDGELLVALLGQNGHRIDDVLRQLPQIDRLT